MANNKNNNEDAFAQYASTVENTAVAPVSDTISNPPSDLASKAKDRLSAQFNEASRIAESRPSVAEERETASQRVRQEAIDKGMTLAPVRMEDLPSKGMFYPHGTQIYIRPVRLDDIKRWTSMDETDAYDINAKSLDILNSCCHIVIDGYGKRDYKSLLDIDRLYLLLAIHDYSFKNNEGFDIMVKVDENNDVVLTKDTVDYIDFGENLLKFYDEDRHCFRFPVENERLFEKTGGMMEIYMPTIGVVDWTTNYVRSCEQRRDTYDQAAVKYINLLVKDWTSLNNAKAYTNMVSWISEWGYYELTLISRVYDRIVASTTVPTMRFFDEGGVERRIPLNFRHGIKSIFQKRLAIDI